MSPVAFTILERWKSFNHEEAVPFEQKGAAFFRCDRSKSRQCKKNPHAGSSFFNLNICSDLISAKLDKFREHFLLGESECMFLRFSAHATIQPTHADDLHRCFPEKSCKQ